MMAKPFTNEELRAILEDFGVKDAVAILPFGSGHINDTFKIVRSGGEPCILQRINTDIFTNADGMMENIVRVTRHIRSKGAKTLEVLGYKRPWRLYSFVSGAKTIEVIAEPSQAYIAANAFARFQNMLADLPEPRLVEILPRFHDTPNRIALLEAAVKADVKGRLAGVRREIDFVMARRGTAGRIVNAIAAGDIPERTTHNDTKINNVLLFPENEGGSVVIDLDTTMPGSALYDFGDMVRTSTAAAAEDERDLDKVYSKKEYFEALVRGYLGSARFLNAAELDSLAFSGRLITLTIGIRFLTDYLAGDTYFKISSPDHNLVRCRTQFKMVESLEAQAAEYKDIVFKVAREEGLA